MGSSACRRTRRSSATLARWGLRGRLAETGRLAHSQMPSSARGRSASVLVDPFSDARVTGSGRSMGGRGHAWRQRARGSSLEAVSATGPLVADAADPPRCTSPESGVAGATNRGVKSTRAGGTRCLRGLPLLRVHGDVKRSARNVRRRRSADTCSRDRRGELFTARDRRPSRAGGSASGRLFGGFDGPHVARADPADGGYSSSRAHLGQCDRERLGGGRTRHAEHPMCRDTLAPDWCAKSSRRARRLDRTRNPVYDREGWRQLWLVDARATLGRQSRVGAGRAARTAVTNPPAAPVEAVALT